MQYLVKMHLATSARPATAQEGETFIEQIILPTLELCKCLTSAEMGMDWEQG